MKPYTDGPLAGWFLTAALVAAALFTAASAEPAGADKGKLTLANCAGQEIVWCSYDKNDMIMRVANRSGAVKKEKYETGVTCGSSGGCKVKLIKNKFCDQSTLTDAFVSTTRVEEAAYRLRKGADGHYSIDKVSNERSYFDNLPYICRADHGASCTGEDQCNSSICAGGVCCASSPGTCQTCGQAGSGGKPTNVAKGAQGLYCATANHACDGAGNCLVTHGGTCKANSDCLDKLCLRGKCELVKR